MQTFPSGRWKLYRNGGEHRVLDASGKDKGVSGVGIRTPASLSCVYLLTVKGQFLIADHVQFVLGCLPNCKHRAISRKRRKLYAKGCRSRVRCQRWRLPRTEPMIDKAMKKQARMYDL